MGQLIHNNSHIYQLFNLVQSNLYTAVSYLNKEGYFLYCNQYAINTYKQDPRGKTLFDVFFYDCAASSFEDNLNIIYSNSATSLYKNYEITLINGEKRQYFAIKTPWEVHPGYVGGLLVQVIDIDQLLYNDYLPKLQSLILNIKSTVEKILFLSCAEDGNQHKNNTNVIELQIFARKLLTHCKKIFNDYGINDNKEIINLHQKFNVRNLIKEVIRQKINLITNVHFFLEISDQVPEIVMGNIFKIKKILQLIVEEFIKAAFPDKKTVYLIKLQQINKIASKFAILFFSFRGQLSIFRQYNFDLFLVKDMIKELNGESELLKVNNDFEIIIRLPVILINYKYNLTI